MTVQSRCVVTASAPGRLIEKGVLSDNALAMNVVHCGDAVLADIEALLLAHLHSVLPQSARGRALH